MIISVIQPSNVLSASKKFVKSLSVSKKALTITAGKSKSISYKVKAKGKASKKITLKVSNSNVKAKIKKGKILITAKKAGNSKIAISTKAKNKKGKKIKKAIKVKIIKKNTSIPTKTSRTTNAIPSASLLDTGIEVTKSEWVLAVMNTTGYNIQKDLFDHDENGNTIYSFTDIKDTSNADMIETAVKYGIIPNSGGEFHPDDAADREFLAVTSIRAIGFATDELEINYDDKASLKYGTEDAIAIQLELLELSDNKFLPTKRITKIEKQKAEKILSDIVKDREIDEKHVDVIEYSEDVVNEKNVTDYTISEKDGLFTVMTSVGTRLDEAKKGDKIILPATDRYPEGIALVVASNTISENGKNRMIAGIVPDSIKEFVDIVDIEGEVKVDAKNITAVDGVSAVEVIEGQADQAKQNASRTRSKRANIEGEADLKDRTKILITIKELETTVSFYLSELKYRVDFDKKGVNDLYIGLPSVLSLETDYKARKNFSEKIGDIPIKLAAGFSVNIEVYLEASISGEISMNLKLSNNIGMHYYNGKFYVEKGCEPSFDMLADADIDAGAKLQLGLYWMKGIQEVFGKSDPRPVYNIYTKWGIHGDASIHIRNDQYTSYKNLTCIDLGYYLYGKVNVGDGSFLGDKFNLRKGWVIFNGENSPLKGNWHIENGKLVTSCTYKTGLNFKTEFIVFRLGSANSQETYQGTKYSCDIKDADGSVTLIVNHNGYDIEKRQHTKLRDHINYAEQHGQYFLTTSSAADYGYLEIISFDAASEKTEVLTDKMMGYNVINNKIYMVVYKKAANANTNPMTDCICDVVTCDLNGKNLSKLRTDVRIQGYIEEITESYVKSTLWNWDDNTSQDFILNY